MKKYKIIIAYDGTQYKGWQQQRGHPTITNTLQNTFQKVFNTSIHIQGASRTDAGVHALGQAAIFSTDLVISSSQMLFAWQNILPSSILIRDLKEVPSDWNPRHSVKQKIYYYHFFDHRPLPFIAPYGLHVRSSLDLQKLKMALQVFVGTHDFRSFCSGQEYENTVRTIDAITFEYFARFNIYRITFKGPGFLRYMIRRIVGACLEVASNDTMNADNLRIALDKKNPLQMYPTAPAHGLVLYKIIYND